MLIQQDAGFRNIKASMMTLDGFLTKAPVATASMLRLLAMVQSSRSDEHSDMGMGAPAADSYVSHSGRLVAMLEGMKSYSGRMSSPRLYFSFSCDRERPRCSVQTLSDACRDTAETETVTDGLSPWLRSRRLG